MVGNAHPTKIALLQLVQDVRQIAKFWLAPISLEKNRGFKEHELNQIARLVEEQLPFSNNFVVALTTTCAAPVKKDRSIVPGTSLGWW